MHDNPYPHWAYSDPRWLVPHVYVSARFNEPSQSQNTLRQPSPFPTINTQVFNTSAQKFQDLLKQADFLASKIVNSKEFAHDLMDAAQLSNTQKVDALILSTGITLKVKTHYSPSGIRIELTNAENEGNCCNLLMTLKW